MPVKKWMLLAALLAACSRNPAPGTTLPGSVAPRQAATDFLNAVRAQDLQAMSTVWGNERGPARDYFDRAELDKRLLVMQSCYSHDRFQVLDESPGSGGTSLVRVQLVRGNRTKTTNFVAHKGPGNRYFVDVRNPDFSAMSDFCAR
jgi:hypothetical protein